MRRDEIQKQANRTSSVKKRGGFTASRGVSIPRDTHTHTITIVDGGYSPWSITQHDQSSNDARFAAV